MSNKYAVIVEAKIDDSANAITSMQTSLDNAAKKVVFTIKQITVDKNSLVALRTQIEDTLKGLPITINGATNTGTGTAGGGTGKGGTPPPPGTPLSSYGATGALVNQERTYAPDGKQIAQIDTYNQSVGETIKVISRWDESLKGLALTKTKETENTQKSIDFNRKLDESLSELAIAQEKIKMSPVATTGGLPQPKAIQDVTAALSNYENTIKRIQAGGGQGTTAELNNLKQVESEYDQATDKLKLYEKQEQDRINTIAQETQAIKTLATAQEKLNNAKAMIEAGGTLRPGGNAAIETNLQDMANLENATKDYETILTEIQTKGGVISKEDAQRLVVSGIELDKMTTTLKEEVAIQDQIIANNVKNNTELDRQNKAADVQITKAQALADRLKASMTNTDPGNATVIKAKKAYDDLTIAIDNKNKAEGQSPAVVKKASDALDKATISAQNVSTALGTVGKNANSWMNDINVAIKRTIEWAAATTLLYGSLRQIQAGIQYVKDLNKELVNIQVVTGGTNAEMARLSTEFNKLAIEMGATNIEIAKGKQKSALLKSL